MDKRKLKKGKRDARKEKNWCKFMKKYDQPYMTTYQGFLKEVISTGLFEQNTPDLISED